MRVHGHVVIIAVTRAEVTPRHNFVIPSRQRLLSPVVSGSTGGMRSSTIVSGCIAANAALVLASASGD